MSASPLSGAVRQPAHRQFFVFRFGASCEPGARARTTQSDFDIRPSCQLWLGFIFAGADAIAICGGLLYIGLDLNALTRLQDLIILTWAVLVSILARSVGQYSVISRYDVLKSFYNNLWFGALVFAGVCYFSRVETPPQREGVTLVQVMVIIAILTVLMTSVRLLFFFITGHYRDHFIERIMLVAKPGAIPLLVERHLPKADYCSIACCQTIDTETTSASENGSARQDCMQQSRGSTHHTAIDNPAYRASFLAFGVDRIVLISDGLTQADISSAVRQLEHLPPEITATSSLASVITPDRPLSRSNCIVLCRSATTHLDQMMKRAFDIVVSGLLLLVLSPVLILIAIAIRLESAGPAIFRQLRSGWNHETFVVYKFRTMWVSADTNRQATRNDRRVTRVGSFLRRTSLDEVPQLLNVLGGSMSLVGPRPHPVDLNEHFRHLIDRYCVRHRVVPGLTGWAQVNGCRGATETRKAMEDRIRLDLEYIQKRSFFFDIWIILRTVTAVIGGKNAY
jgi:exopolysaccharide biosynthesis polyprenyl glycosylphosphotransferase